MENYEGLREDYIRGVPGELLCKHYAVEPGELRACASAGRWAQEKKLEAWRRANRLETLQTHMRLTDRLLSLVSAALEDETELYRYTATNKMEFTCETINCINEDRLGKLVKAIGELMELQRETLDLGGYKEKADARAAAKKLGNDREAAMRKLDIELMKLEQSGGGISESLLEALGGVPDGDE